MAAFLFILLLLDTAYRSNAQISQCDTVYTIGADELCRLSLSSFTEDCVTFNETHNIVATNGLALDPITGNMYIIASIGAKNGDRKLLHLDPTTNSLTTIAIYTNDNHKMVGLTATCSGQLFGITGGQSDHSLFEVDISDGSLSFVADLDASSRGNGIAYDPMDDHLYRIGGSDTLDIEQIDFFGNITSDYFVNEIDIVRTIGYYKEDYLFIIDGDEVLYELDTLSGNVTHLADLNNVRRHKGILCVDYDAFCIETTTFIPDTTVIEANQSNTLCSNDTYECSDVDGTVVVRSGDNCEFEPCPSADIVNKIRLLTNMLFVACLYAISF